MSYAAFFQLYPDKRGSMDFRRFFCLTILSLCACLLSGQTTYYVNAASGDDSDSGLSWNDAFASIQQALNVTVAGDFIYISEGIYYPSLDATGNIPVDPRDATFFIDKEVEIQGGYADTGNPGPGSVDTDLNPTILSGDLGVIGDPADNAYTVVHSQHVGGGGLRNLWIQDGRADGSGSVGARGGGWYCEATSSSSLFTIVTDCRFIDNYAIIGGAIYLEEDGGVFDLSILNSVFRNNQSSSHGGAIYISGDGGIDRNRIYSNLFWGNIAGGVGGAFAYDDPNSGKPTFSYCTFAENIAAGGGGLAGIHFWDSGMEIPWFFNCISWDNGSTFQQTSTNLGGILLDECLIEESSCPTGATCFGSSVIFNEDPLFVDPISGDFHLQACSPAVDEGNFSTFGGSFDFDNDPRPFNGLWDMGYDEYTGASCCPSSNIIYVNAIATGANTGTSWADAFTDLQSAIDFVRSGFCPSVDRIWVAGGTYYPSKDANGDSNPVDPRDKAFYIDFSINIVGSFPSTGNPGPNDVDYVTHPTILSGDLGTQGLTADNAYTVVHTFDLGIFANFRYLVIGDGNADGNLTSRRGTGGGWLNEASSGNVSSPSINTVVFRDNTAGLGGGFLNDGRNATASPNFTNCEFRNNFSSSNGGAIYSLGDNGTTSPFFHNCLFWGNIATGIGGVLGYDDGQQGTAEFQHCTFYENVAAGSGGVIGISFWDSGQFPLLMQNCIAWANGSTFAQTTGGAGVLEINFSMIQESSCPTGAICSGMNLFNQPPQFVDADNGDFHLDPCSPAIDAGVDVTINTLDFENQIRPGGAGFDMGYDEFYGSSCCPAGSAVFVNVNASGNNNGTSWANAFTDLQDALDFVMAGSCSAVDEVWVATGTYLPTTDINDSPSPADPRTKVFHYEGPAKVYGGFVGTETMLSQRDPATNSTYLSGDLNGGDTSDNAYTVVQFTGGDMDYLLDGFTISGGNANGSSLNASGLGGGILIGEINGNSFSKPSIENCVISLNSANFGGGVCVQGDGNFQVQAYFENCRFEFNTATFSGAGLFNNVGDGLANPILENCVFDNNLANGFGGAIHSIEGTGSITGRATNCLFINNQAGLGGSVMSYGDPAVGGFFFRHCTMADNSTTSGAAIQILDWDGVQAALGVFQCILWDNGITFQAAGLGTQANFNECIIEENNCPTGASCNSTLFNQNPLFVDPGVNNYHLAQCSPAIDAGPGGTPITDDLDGDPRPNGPSNDIGSDEYTGAACCPTGNVVYVNVAASGSNTGLNWTDAFTDLQSAIDLIKSGTCGSANEIWVASGTYLPTKDISGNASPADPRDKTFFFDADMGLYAGFAGTETDRSQRDHVNNVTMLSGDIGLGLDSTDNAYHVVFSRGVSQDLKVYGFFIQDGQADGTGDRSNGAGWYNETGSMTSSDPDITECVFTANYASNDGGAMYNNGVGADVRPSLNRCTFYLNEAGASGGAVFNDRARPFIVDCAFGTNTAGEDGGAMFNNGFMEESNTVYINCSFIGNTAGQEGGAIYNNGNSMGGGCNTILTNCLFGNNRASRGGAIYYDAFDATTSGILQNATFSGNIASISGDAIYFQAPSGVAAPLIRNCIFWANGPNNESLAGLNGTPSLSHSILPEATCPSGMICGSGMLFNQNPQFIDLLGGDFNLQMSSPAIDAGTTGNSTNFDLEGNSRNQGSAIDLGPLESPFTALPVEWLYFRAEPSGDKQALLSWATASEISSDYFQIERSGNGRQFEAIGQLPAAGFSDHEQGYEWIDEQPLDGSNFYRLRQVDIDETFSFSTMEHLWLSGTSAGFMVYPNPATDQVIVQTEGGRILLRDLLGRTVKTVVAETSGTTIINIQDLSFGTYWIELEGRGERQRLIIQ